MAIKSGAHAVEPSNNDRVTSWEGTWTPLPGGSGEEGGNDARSASGSASGTAIGVGCGALLLALAGLVTWRYRRHDKGLQVCEVTLLGGRGYWPATTGNDGGGSGSAEGPAEVGDSHGRQVGDPKTYYGSGGEKPYGETMDPDPVRGGGAAAPGRI
ncbi:hypothetical protein DL766_008422 [Monosporascus sp. MC13-8B]|uniref:Uncharacterized protein n=1 Tax=Monosporascus cannonballus TaxID=155416 RepID=A0ABY0GZN5_9PEZI|nr:hypothetical protein DL762_008830 [Monosporascus cannonballus]RYO79057.1 hypothetical protein DL763_009431 [Monosporascus cannonballus]RYP19503.1 hypothetical protein DL766_008422 [Monosporascus sp. MC13-8B]